MGKLSITSCVVTGVIVYGIYRGIYTIITFLLRLGHLYKHASKFEGPPGLPLIGNTHQFIGNSEAILNHIISLGKVYPAPYRAWLGFRLMFLVNTPEYLKVVLLSPKTIEKGDLYELVKAWLGTGLITASAAKWRVHRNLIQPTFHVNILHSFVETFVAQSLIMAEQMKKHLNGAEFEIHDYVSMCFLSSICETSMGVRLDAQADSEYCYAHTAIRVLESLTRRCFRPWLHPDFIFYRTQEGKKQRKDIKILHEITANVVKAKKKELFERKNRSGVAGGEDDKCDSMPRRKVFLDHLIDISIETGKLSDESLREEVDTMIVAGSDTTTGIGSFLMLMLASHPEVQEKVYQELCEIYGEDDGDEVNIVPEDLARMTYLERVIKETMRLFPITPILIRNVTEDLDIDGRTLPNGSTVVLGIMEVHRNPNYWRDPLIFDPDRFLPEEVAKRNSYAYLPFGGGPRSCIGLKYAMLSMKTLVTIILRRYILRKDYITPVKDIRLKIDLLLKPVIPISLRIEKRTRKPGST